MKNIIVCYAQSEPTANQECREAINSEGRSCRKCPFTCYRQGWKKGEVTKDNAKIVEANRQKAG